MRGRFPVVSQQEVELWMRALAAHRLFETMAKNKPAATRFFGPAAFKRQSYWELSQIACARKVLVMSKEALMLEVEQVDAAVEGLAQGPTAPLEGPLVEGGVQTAIAEHADSIESRPSPPYCNLWATAAKEICRESVGSCSDVAMMQRLALRVMEIAFC